jgi:hypothetical protein
MSIPLSYSSAVLLAERPGNEATLANLGQGCFKGPMNGDTPGNNGPMSGVVQPCQDRHNAAYEPSWATSSS